MALDNREKGGMLQAEERAEEGAAMKARMDWMRKAGMAGVLWAIVALLLGCSPAKESGASQQSGGPAGRLQDSPWMDGEHWGMTPDEVGMHLKVAPVLQSESSDYYSLELDGRKVVAQYVFGKGDGADRALVRKIIYLTNPKRAAFLPLLPAAEAEATFGTVRAQMDGICGSSSVVTQQMAVSLKLESQSRSVGDRVLSAEKEVRVLDREWKERRQALQRQYAGYKNRNALVAAGLVDLDKNMQQAQRKLMGLRSDQNQIRMEIRAECEALPEKYRPFLWESEWQGEDGTAALWLRINNRGTFLALSFTAPD